ncbi:hypothetical protein ES708_24531 [subsurface metagenome]
MANLILSPLALKRFEKSEKTSSSFSKDLVLKEQMTENLFLLIFNCSSFLIVSMYLFLIVSLSLLSKCFLSLPMSAIKKLMLSTSSEILVTYSSKRFAFSASPNFVKSLLIFATISSFFVMSSFISVFNMAFID